MHVLFPLRGFRVRLLSVCASRVRLPSIGATRVHLSSIHSSRVRLWSIGATRVRPLSIWGRKTALDGRITNPDSTDGPNPNPRCTDVSNPNPDSTDGRNPNPISTDVPNPNPKPEPEMRQWPVSEPNFRRRPQPEPCFPGWTRDELGCDSDVLTANEPYAWGLCSARRSGAPRAEPENSVPPTAGTQIRNIAVRGGALSWRRGLMALGCAIGTRSLRLARYGLRVHLGFRRPGFSRCYLRMLACCAALTSSMARSIALWMPSRRPGMSETARLRARTSTASLRTRQRVHVEPREAMRVACELIADGLDERHRMAHVVWREVVCKRAVAPQGLTRIENRGKA